MKQSRVLKTLAFILPLIAIALLYGHHIGLTANARPRPQAAANSAAPPQQLTPEGQAALRAAIDSGNLAQLRWPDFSDYTKLVKEFYDSYGNSLPWVRGMQPTTQAQQVIALLLQAGQKGIIRRRLRRPRLDRPPREAQTYRITTHGSGRRAIRSRAYHLCDEICLRPAHRQGQSQTF